MAKRRTKDNIVKIEAMGDYQVPFYRITTADGLDIVVPKYVRRIYSYSKSKRKVTAAGWQIAFIRQDFDPFNPFFPDGEHGPDVALERATEKLRRFLSRIPDTKRSGLKVRDTKTPIFRTGMPGIRLSWRFGRRSCLYDLQVEVRAGAYRPDRARLIYVGTEFSANEERLRLALNDALGFRRQQLAYAKANGQTFPPLRGKAPLLDVDITRAYEMLKHHKERDREKLHRIATERVERWMSQKRLYMTFRDYRFYAKSLVHNRQTFKVPDFIELEEDGWHYEYPMPDGLMHGGFSEVSDDPKGDVVAIMAKCFLECLMTNIPVPVDRLFDDGKRFSTLSKKPLDKPCSSLLMN